MSIRSLLVANRGEIALRVFRTARDMGITTTAVFVEADANAPFVVEADVAVRLADGGYLDGEAIIAAANHYQYDMSIVSSAVEVNYRQRDRILTKLQDHLKVLRGTTVGVLGLTFKGGTNDLRDAPAITLIQRLHNHGVVVRAHDPVAIPYSKKQFPNLTVAYCDEVLSLARGCDAVVIATDWPQYRSLPLTELRGAMKGELLLDARNLLNPDEVVRAGLTYVGVGR